MIVIGGHAPNQGFRRTVLMNTAVLFFMDFVGMIVIGVPGIKVMSVFPISFKLCSWCRCDCHWGWGGGGEEFGCGRFDFGSDIGDDGRLLSSWRSDSLQSHFHLFLLTGVSQVIASELQAGGSTVTVCMSAAKLIAPETIKAHTT